jgi:TIR domain
MQKAAEFDVFLSHSSKDKPVVRVLAERLTKSGLRVWFDEWEIPIGAMIAVKIEEGLAKSNFVILCMSKHAVGSDWATLESRSVLFSDPLNRQLRLIPLLLDDTPIPELLKGFKYLDWRKPSDEAFSLLLAACRNNEALTSFVLSPAASPQLEDANIARVLPNDDERIAQTRQAILNCLHRDHFDGVPNLNFAPDGMPGVLAQAFSDKDGSMARVEVADRCVYAVLKFARELVEAYAKLPAVAPVAVQENKNRLWKNLVNAMQHAILLSARQNYTDKRRIADAFNGATSCEVEGMSWLSASMIMRESLADSLRSNPSQPSGNFNIDPMEDSHAGDWSEIEFGTGVAARVQGYKALKYLLDRGTFPDDPNQREIEELQGQLRLRKRDGLHLLIFSQTMASFPPEFIGWLNKDMHVGHITILARHGEFELKEGDWRTCLAEMLKVMRAFEPAPIRQRINR